MKGGGEENPARGEYNSAQKYKTPGARTTVMIRNIPFAYTQDELLYEVVEKLGRGDLFDFLYLPRDSGNRSNRGYAFVNFKDTASVRIATIALADHVFKNGRGHKAFLIPAHIQGLENNLRFFLNRSVGQRNHACSPVVMCNGELVELSDVFLDEPQWDQDLPVHDRIADLCNYIRRSSGASRLTARRPMEMLAQAPQGQDFSSFAGAASSSAGYPPLRGESDRMQAFVTRLVSSTADANGEAPQGPPGPPDFPPPELQPQMPVPPSTLVPQTKLNFASLALQSPMRTREVSVVPGSFLPVDSSNAVEIVVDTTPEDVLVDFVVAAGDRQREQFCSTPSREQAGARSSSQAAEFDPGPGTRWDGYG